MITYKQRNNATKKLVERYGWKHHWSWCWDYGQCYEKDIPRNKDAKLYVETNLNGIGVYISGYCPVYPTITYEEIKLFEKISNYYKNEYENANREISK